MDHVVEAHLQEADVRLRRVSASDAGSDRHTPEREQTFVEDVAEVFYGHFGVREISKLIGQSASLDAR